MPVTSLVVPTSVIHTRGTYYGGTYSTQIAKNETFFFKYSPLNSAIAGEIRICAANVRYYNFENNQFESSTYVPLFLAEFSTFFARYFKQFSIRNTFTFVLSTRYAYVRIKRIPRYLRSFIG